MGCNNPGKRELDWSRVNVWSASRTGDTFGLNVRWALKGLFLNGRTHNHSNNNNKKDDVERSSSKCLSLSLLLLVPMFTASNMLWYVFSWLLTFPFRVYFRVLFSFFSCGLSVRDTIGKKRNREPWPLLLQCPIHWLTSSQPFLSTTRWEDGGEKKREAPWKKKKEKCLYPFLLLSCCV